MYSTRVMRPDVTKLNPYRDESDPDHIRQGNPALRGEYAHRLAAHRRTDFNNRLFELF